MNQYIKTEAAMRWAAIALLALAFILYLATLDNGLQPHELEGGDLITHQYAQVQARPSNAPGYPLYTMGGWLWFHSWRVILDWLPDANPMLILSSYSIIWALLALWLLYKILCHLTRTETWPYGNWPLAWLCTLFYSVTYFFWYYATTTEQYSSAVAHTLAIVYWGLLVLDKYEKRRLYFLAFLCGLALAHMLTVAFIVPPLVLIILWQMPWLLRQFKIIGTTICAAALPLLSYSYVYLRGAAHPEWRGGDWANSDATSWFWWFLSTPQGREELGWGLEPRRAFFGNGFPELIWQELSIPILVIGLLGILWLGRQRAILFYGTLIIYGLFCWAYRYGNWFQVILPAYPLIIIGFAVVVHQVTQKTNFQGKAHSLRYAMSLLLLAFAIIWRVQASLPSADSRNRPEDTGLDRAAILLNQPLPNEAALFADRADTHALQYLLDIWQLAPSSGLVVVSSQEAAHALNQGKTVLSTREMVPTLQAELPQAWLTDGRLAIQSGSPDWIRWQLDVTSQSHRQMAVELNEMILGTSATPEIILQGYEDAPNSLGLDVILFWQIFSDQWPADLSISVRPTWQGAFIPDGHGQIIQQDRSAPAHGFWSRGAYPVDYAIADGYRLPLQESQLADGFMVIVYRTTESGFENLTELRLPLGD